MNNISESINKPRQKPIYLWLLGLIVIMVFLIYGLVSYNRWYDSHYYHTEFPVLVRLSWPVQVWERKPQVIKQQLPEYAGLVDTPIKQYVCTKFGVMDCKIALGIIQAESGFNDSALHINSNNTIDYGLFQINSIHFKQDGCSLHEIVDPIQNVNCAYSIYKASGNKWNSWTTFQNNSYLSFL